MLKIQNLQVAYGGIQALRGIDMEVPDGKIVTLIGANGAGKSTTLRTISGLVKAKSGSITYNNEQLLGKPINAILAAGIAQVPEGRRVFPDMTVLENLKIGAYLRKDERRSKRGYPVGAASSSRLKERNLATRRHALRRRAADAGRRPRADVPPEGADDGRALPRPCAAGRAGNL